MTDAAEPTREAEGAKEPGRRLSPKKGKFGRALLAIGAVALGSPFFEAALGVVEAGVMQLPDGRNFRPSDGLSGIEFYGMLMEAAAYR